MGMAASQLRLAAVAAVCMVATRAQHVSSFMNMDYSAAADRGNYSCDELTRWIGNEKHYSNDKRELFFNLVTGQDCTRNPAPVLMLADVSFGPRRKYFRKEAASSSVSSSSASVPLSSTSAPSSSSRRHKECKARDTYAVTFLSNFSINNNFSHFLHGLLRLFCALIDARWIVWDPVTRTFVRAVEYTLWLDEYFKSTPEKLRWLDALAMGGKVRPLNAKALPVGECVTARRLLYGSGCVKLLPPEKWHGYPHCRATEVLPAFGHFMRQVFGASGIKDLTIIDHRSEVLHESFKKGPSLRIAFAVRDASALTGKRSIANLADVQRLLRKTQHIKTITENITFEHFDVAETVRYMASAHVFVSVHGAGMTNMFFMNPGSAIVEIIPYPLCNCDSPDYFYGVGGYYHGSAVAAGIRHYPYCVGPEDTMWHTKPKNLKDGAKCSWKYLHAVEAMRLDATRFVSLLRSVEKDLVVNGMITLTNPIILMHPGANG